RRGMGRRLRVGMTRVVGIFRRRRGRWTKRPVRGETALGDRGARAGRPAGTAASGGAPEATGAPVDLEPHLAAAIVAVDAPAARQPGGQGPARSPAPPRAQAAR